MVELVFAIVLCSIFFMMSSKEKKFEANRSKYIDEGRVYTNDESPSDEEK